MFIYLRGTRNRRTAHAKIVPIKTYLQWSSKCPGRLRLGFCFFSSVMPQAAFRKGQELQQRCQVLLSRFSPNCALWFRTKWLQVNQQQVGYWAMYSAAVRRLTLGIVRQLWKAEEGQETDLSDLSQSVTIWRSPDSNLQRQGPTSFVASWLMRPQRCVVRHSIRWVCWDPVRQFVKLRVVEVPVCRGVHLPPIEMK